MQHIFSHFERAASCSVFCVHYLSKIELYALILFNNPMKGLWTSNRWLGFFNTELFLGGQSPEGPCRLQLLLDVKVARALKSPHRESNLLWQVISLFFIPFWYKVHHQIIPHRTPSPCTMTSLIHVRGTCIKRQKITQHFPRV